ncbi:unnamed protein product [Heligmosomoides polygyrus]|uniref:Uncharacterized protein n=1 Tax=Heligmosomoides polygyrus TaxID=6339 RepID=A0A183GTF8_HELPZ|nr:unnamed protein product [Heligmosomoides polygyrus]
MSRESSIVAARLDDAAVAKNELMLGISVHRDKTMAEERQHVSSPDLTASKEEFDDVLQIEKDDEIRKLNEELELQKRKLADLGAGRSRAHIDVTEWLVQSGKEDNARAPTLRRPGDWRTEALPQEKRSNGFATLVSSMRDLCKTETRNKKIVALSELRKLRKAETQPVVDFCVELERLTRKACSELDEQALSAVRPSEQLMQWDES